MPKRKAVKSLPRIYNSMPPSTQTTQHHLFDPVIRQDLIKNCDSLPHQKQGKKKQSTDWRDGNKAKQQTTSATGRH